MKNKKIKYLVLSILVFALFISVGCFDNSNFEIKSSIDTTNVFVDDEFVVKILSDSSDDISWSSSNTDVLTVSSDGVCKAISKGTALIWATSGEDIASMKFTVYESPEQSFINTYICSQELYNIELQIGDAILLTCTDKETGEYQNGVFSTKSNIVEITDEGILLAKTAGTCEVTYTSDDDSFTFEVNVIAKTGLPTLTVTGKQTTEIGKTISLKATISSSAYKKGFTWKSSNEAIATVTESGTVTGVSGGLCTITVTSIDNTQCTAEYLVYVVPEYSSMSVIINEIYQITGSGDFTELSDTVVKIAEDNYDAVIGVSNMQSYNGSMVEMSLGTGMIYKKAGNEYYVLTNNHVVSEAEELRIYYQKEELYITGTLVASDSDLDLAVVKFESEKEFKTVTLGNMDTVKQGEFVLAMGHPTGYDYYNSVTFGTISYVNRRMTGEAALFIQHDAAINSGNSGGPLFNMQGEVIGVNTLKMAKESIDNMGFAVTIGEVRGFLETYDLLP